MIILAKISASAVKEHEADNFRLALPLLAKSMTKGEKEKKRKFLDARSQRFPFPMEGDRYIQSKSFSGPHIAAVHVLGRLPQAIKVISIVVKYALT